MNTLQIIADWKVEAKNEKDTEYFVPFSMMDRITDGRRLIITGRKGTGKTAIAKYLQKTREAVILNFDLVQFKSLAKFSDDTFNSNHEFLSVWTYIIMMAAIEKSYRDGEFDFDTRRELSPYFEAADLTTPSKISRWTKLNFGMNAGGVGGANLAVERSTESNAANFRSNISRLEQIIKTANLKKVFVVFDEIDDDVDNLGISRTQYINLVTSLVRASLNISSSEFSKYISPLVCLREDLLHSIGNEKTKWSDSIYNLFWNEEKIKIMLAKKLSIALGGAQGGFYDLWNSVVDGGDLKTTSGKKLSYISYIGKYTQNRPRDYIFFIREAARISAESELEKIGSAAITAALGPFSEYMRDEANSELKMIFPEWEVILPSLTEIGKPLFKMNEFSEAYNRNLRNVSNHTTSHSVLMAMYKFNIIGNTYSNSPKFRYQESVSAYRLTQTLAIHPSLFHALSIR